MAEIQHDSAAQRFTAVVEGHTAELDYTLSDGLMTITHTEVPAAIGGRGIAGELVRAALGVARRAGWKVYPACSYAAAYLAEHPEESGLRGPDAQVRHEEDLIDESIQESFPASDPPSVGRSD